MTAPTQQLPDIPQLTEAQKAQCHDIVFSTGQGEGTVLWAIQVAERPFALGQQTARDVQAEPVRRLVDEQAEDDGLWFVASTATEAYLQLELRKLHAAIEAAPPASDVQPVGAVAEGWQPDRRTVQWCYEKVCALYYAPLDTADGETPCAGEAFHAIMDHFKSLRAAAPALQGESGATVADQRDATRWRWLRESTRMVDGSVEGMLTIHVIHDDAAPSEIADDLNVAIDAAMAAQDAAGEQS